MSENKAEITFNDRLIEILATGLYFGKSPKAPGTVGTLWGIPLAWGLVKTGPFLYMGATVLLAVAGIFIAQHHENRLGVHDSGEIVFDEIVGFLITMVWIPLTWQSLLAGFVLFRILDAAKPPPIKQVDQRIQGGLGVMADDIVAGIIANVLLQIMYMQTSWLGIQWAA